MDRWEWLFLTVTVAVAGGVGLLSAAYWLDQVLALSCIATVVGLDSLRRLNPALGYEEDQPVPRSRIMHYARIAKVQDSGRLVRTAGNAFEEELMKQPGWAGMSSEELRELARRLPSEGPHPVDAD